MPSKPPPGNPPPKELAPESKADKATLELIKGRGFVLTFSSHFLVAVIVGVLGWMYAQQKGEHAPVPDEVTQILKNLQLDTATLKGDFQQFKAERVQSDRMVEWRLNQMTAQLAGAQSKP